MPRLTEVLYSGQISEGPPVAEFEKQFARFVGVGMCGRLVRFGLLILIPEWLRFLKSIPGLYLAIYGLAVILIVLFMPDGIWGFI